MKQWSLILVIILMFSCKDKTQDIKVSEDRNQITFHQVQDVQLYAGSVHRVDSFPSAYITPRPVDVWLPENYSEDKSYAVLYMHDGQMLFDASTTWNKQEWKVDEWASKLMNDQKTIDFIVVGIHNIPDLRWQDLFPQKAMDYMNEKTKDSLIELAKANNFNVNFNGDNYLKFMVEELKPVIDNTYAVFKDKAHTFVAGSSMGGLMSMYAISEYPEIFEGAACISTHWIGVMPMPENPYPDAIFDYMKAKLPSAKSHQLYFDYGNKTLDQYYPEHAPKVDAILKEKGYTDSNSKNLFFEGTDHSEVSWSQRLDQPLLFLLGRQ
ncbi:alpha/beta hydrolase [Psychroserpens sp. SPM9]|uniref:alpha/beta hydrolase n=1 Tax=Psychroserpens sp. SPM9 TaxID=2975598 RepID=UPI0021A7493E|nr:alpha/beta hydrolase-fold protein [Psychroserpens sp. SPM9]MDG5490301.1 alpha/beta hydrolase-fold protein [Psychroserpens sp. SPM9]